MVIAITGASRGIGHALARDLSEHGATVYACARTSMPTLHDVRTAIVDLRESSAVNDWAASIRQAEGRVDMLINNAAIVGQRAPFVEIPLAVWADVVATNILGTVAITRAMLPLLRHGTASTIVNIGSIMGRFGRAGWTPYVSTKFALEGLTQALAQEFFRFGIRVVTLHPSRINTRLRQTAYGDEELFAPEHLASLLNSVRWILANPLEPLSGLTLSADDLAAWSEHDK